MPGIDFRNHWPPNKTAAATRRLGRTAAWQWGVSRLLDYFETDKAVDARQLGSKVSLVMAKPPGDRAFEPRMPPASSAPP